VELDSFFSLIYRAKARLEISTQKEIGFGFSNFWEPHKIQESFFLFL
jgi:hypothetical protein